MSSALSLALNGLRSHDHNSLSHNRTSPSPIDGYSNLRGSPPNGQKSTTSTIRRRSGSPDSIQRFVDVPRTTTDTLDSSSAFSPPNSNNNSYRLSNNHFHNHNRSLSPAGSVASITSSNAIPPISSVGNNSPLIIPASPTSTNAANVLLQTSQSYSSSASSGAPFPSYSQQIAQPSSLSKQLAQSSSTSTSARHEHHLISAKTSAIAAASPRNRRLSTSTSHTPTGSYVAKSSPGLPPVGSASSSLLKSHLLQQSTTPVDSPSNGPLNTNSPIAIAAAAAVTPDKLSRLLMTQGPLAIRHITSHLALTISGFADLSLSKQRRLIIAVLDSGDPVNSVVFEKVGWGRWAARKTDSPAAAAAAAAASATTNGSSKHRRDSITAELVSSSVNPPISPVLNAVDSHYLSSSLKNSITTPFTDDVDLADDDMMFHNSVIRKPVRPSHLLQGILRSRRSRRPSQRMRERIAFGADHYDQDDDDDDDDDELARVGVRNSVFDENVFEDDDDLDDLDDLDQEAMDDAIHLGLRRPSRNGGGDTDDEDWQSMGAAKLRRDTAVAAHNKTLIPKNKAIQDDVLKREQEAIDALVSLKSI